MTERGARRDRLADWRSAPASLRYALVSGVCALINNFLLIALVAMGLDYIAAAVAVIPPMLAIGFALQATIAFDEPPGRAAFLRYCVAMLSNQPIWFASLFVLCDVLRLPIYIASPVATVGLFFYNFVATRWAMSRGGAAAGAAVARPRRIAFVCDAVMPWNKGGREMILLQISTRLLKPDQEVHIYTMNWWNGPNVIMRDGVHYHALCAHYPLYVGNRRSTAQALRFSLSVLRLLFEPFDALHVDHMPFFPLYTARVVAWLKGARLTATWHEVWGRDYWLNYMGGPAGWIGYLLERASFPLPDRIASDSLLTTTRLAEMKTRGPVETIPLGVDVATIRAAPAAEHESDIIFVGRLLGHKGAALLVQAAALLAPSHPGLRVLIVGDGPERSSIERMIDELDLRATVTMLGELKDNARVQGLMKASKVLALPSTREGFGLVVLEANAAGVPVVTLRHPDNAAMELIREGVNGYLAEPTAEGLAEKLALTLRARDSLRPDADIEQYDWDIVAERMDRFLWSARA